MTPEYNAFISYRHNPRDTAVAAELQTRMERFHIPKAIQEQTGVKKIDRIFRDQNELELTADLGGSIDEALAHSDYLICILSPEYNESKWCIHEIEQFLKTHDHSRILAVLSAGEPPAIFPEQLLHRPVTRINPDGSEETVMTDTEPLACDYRMDFKKASRIELPRLISGMLGCEYDDLVLRNERYRQRRLLAALSITAALSIAAVLWLLYSNARIQENYRNAQISESRTIASSSLSLLQDGRRLEALQTALTALPSKENDRPITAEAEYALCRASLAYQLPFQTVETGVIDYTFDIVQILPDKDHSTMFLLDNSGMIHVFDTGALAKTASFQLYSAETIRDPIVVNGNLAAWTAGGVVSYARDGTQNWIQELRYTTYGRAAASPDQKLIAAGDLSAVRIMRADNGEPVSSLQLAEEDESYYIDRILWSDDSSRIAVTLRNSAQEDRLGIFDCETGSYQTLGNCGTLLDFCFAEDNSLLALLDFSNQSSFHAGKDSVLYKNDMIIRSYDDTGIRFETVLPVALPNYDGSLYRIPGDSETVLVSAGNRISQLSLTDGTRKAEQEFESSVLCITEAGIDQASAVMQDGTCGIVWFNSRSAFVSAMFPDRITAAEQFVGTDSSQVSYAVLHDGNVRWFSPACDANLTVYNGNGIRSQAEHALLDETRILIQADSELILYDRKTKQEITRTSLAADEVGILLQNTAASDHTAPLLEINTDDGTMTLVSCSLEDLHPIRETVLDIKDYYAEQGFFRQLQEISSEDAHLRNDLFLSALYSEHTNLDFKNGILYYISGDTAPVLHSLSPDAEHEIQIDYGSYIPVFDRNAANAPSLAIGESGRHALILAGDPSTYKVFPAVLDLTDGSIQVLEGTLSNESLLFSEWDSRFAVCGQDGIVIYDTSYHPLCTIPHHGTAPAAMCYAFGSLYTVTPDGILYEYSPDGALRSTLTLSASVSANTMQMGTVTIQPYKTLLAVNTGETMDLIDPAQHASRPAAVIPQHVLAYAEDTDTFLVYLTLDTSAFRVFLPAEFPHYTTEELINRGREELAGAEAG